MKKSLYNIKNDYLELINELEEGELTPELESSLLITQSELNQKSIAYLEVIKDREAFISNVDDEIKRLQAIKKANVNLVDRLEDNLLNAVILFGEYTVGTVTFKTRKSESIEILNEDKIPNEYKTIKQSIVTDKTALKKAIKEGKTIEGCVLNINQNLAIK